MSTCEWKKSSYSAESSDCIYLAKKDQVVVEICESDIPGVVLTTTPAVLGGFIRVVKAGELDRLGEGWAER
jgi:hypothetical protein